ncbi:hypothetical protein PRVXH_000545 [Proteinivorax hydrogeniformans]|uniref:YvlB/LiaX N-terminal domain-containing protein n=1 Tax=Proteinivorax hydrogeniformans TaxID=1826727 RepID=A0AAU8HV29_9FIRM
MSKSKLQVLEMIKEGKVTAKEGLKLLEALDESEAYNEDIDLISECNVEDPTNLRIRITKENEKGKEKDHVIILPLGVIKFLKLFPIATAKIKANNLNLTGEEVLAKAAKGEKGIIKESKDGNKRVIVELI